MAKKMLMALLSVMIVVGLLVVGCAEPTAPEPPEENGEEAAPPEEDEEEEPAAPAEETFVWRAQSPWPSGTPTHDIFMRSVDHLAEITNGRIEMEVQPAGAIVPSQELLDAVGDGVLDAAYSWLGWYSGKDPAFWASGGLPFSFKNSQQLDTWYHQYGGIEMVRELCAEYNVHVAGFSLYNTESFHATKEVRTVEDFDGLKIRAPGGMLADIWGGLGAEVIMLGGEDVFPALERGMIDAVDWTTPADHESLGFHEIAPYFNWPGWHHVPANEFQVNMDKWNELPDDLKETVESWVRVWGWNRANELLILDEEAVATMIEEGGTAITWDEEEVAKIKAVAQDVWQDWAEKSPKTKEMIDSQLELMKIFDLLD